MVNRGNGTGFWDFLIILGIVYVAISGRWDALFVVGGLLLVGVVVFAWRVHRDKIQDRKLLKRAAEAQEAATKRHQESEATFQETCAILKKNAHFYRDWGMPSWMDDESRARAENLGLWNRYSGWM